MSEFPRAIMLKVFDRDVTPERLRRGLVRLRDNGASADTVQLFRRAAGGTYELVTLATSGDIPDPVTVSDTGSVDLTLTGQDISADVLYAGSGIAETAARSDHTHSQLHNPVTIVDTASINLTLSGQQISGVVIPGGVTHNSLSGLTTGDPHTQYVKKAGDIITGGLTVNGNVAAASDLTVSGALTANGNVALGIADNDLTTITGRVRVAGTEPSLAFGTGAGTGPTLNGLHGNDTAGRIIFTTGSAPSANQVIATITFAQVKPDTDYSVWITGTDADAAAAVGTGSLFFDEAGRAAGTWTLRSGAAALSASTSYRLNYLVIELPPDA